ncbi:MAG: SDR family oxidoreductase [Moraxellaceae bacterium]|nr:SDR family oxidoreductase [Moraxellaceae bacterium]MDZ4385852.1 SDR family oxidoreductase [Moraxellaceae bacterium]
MNYFVTGATGFIGKFLLERLLQRPDAEIYVLVRPGSEAKFVSLCQRFAEAASRLHLVSGDITQAGLVSAEDKARLAGHIDHVFHLAAVYDMAMDDATADLVNNEGTRNVVEFANALGGQVRLHHVSSIAVAGEDFVGTFTESMFDQGQPIRHPYYRTKFESEKIVREEARVPYRVYRPGAVVGDSRTGEMDKIDGPYYFFKTIQKLSFTLPKWLPLIAIKGGRVTLVPVDYVAAAMDHIAHQPGLDGKAFFLIQSPAPTMGEMLQTLLQAAHGPELAANLNLQTLHKPVRHITGRLSQIVPHFDDLFERIVGAPPAAVTAAFTQTRYDDSQARAALAGSGIHCPDLRDYADKLWQYWSLYLDIHTKVSTRAKRNLNGKVVVVTGASSGIGFQVAKKVAAAGARVVLVARQQDKLAQAQQVIQLMGGEAYVYPCDLNDMDAIDQCAQQILTDLGHVDVLVNNAGRSIRRAVVDSYDRFHDFERTMQLNYFGAVRMTLNLLPSMAHQKSGHIINISSIGVLTNAARFSAYVASKAALDAFGRCLAAEVKHRHIEITSVYMPLVRTPMIAPTKVYDYAPAWSPQQAANMVMDAMLNKPKSAATGFGQAAKWSYALWPKLNDRMNNQAFRAFAEPKAH